MIRRPPRSTLDRSSAASDVYKRQTIGASATHYIQYGSWNGQGNINVRIDNNSDGSMAVSYTHLRAHETVLDLVCRLLLEKKKNKT